MKRILLIACLSLGMMACSNDDNTQDKEFEIVTLKIDTIIHDDLFGAGREDIGQENMVINTVANWQELIDRIDYSQEGNTSVIAILENASIDFRIEEVLAVFEEVKMYGGYSIDIMKVEEHEKEVIVTINRMKRGGDAPVITQPFHIVKIQKVKKPVVFIELE